MSENIPDYGGKVDAGRSIDWRAHVDEHGVPTSGPVLDDDDAGCQHCHGPLDAKEGVGQYQCPWCIARYPEADDGDVVG